MTLSGNKLPSLTSPPTAADFRCYNASTDGFNFQAVGNYDMLPNERTGAFVLGNYKLTDNVEAYMELLYHKMVAHTQLAPYPFDLVSNNVVIPANQYYNPFGVAFGDNGASSTIALRLASLGNRGLKIANTTELANTGLKGTFGEYELELGCSFQLRKSHRRKPESELPQLQPDRAGAAMHDRTRRRHLHAAGYLQSKRSEHTRIAQGSGDRSISE